METLTETSVESRVLESLQAAKHELDLDELIKAVRAADDNVRAVDVKIAALEMVSRGSLKLSDAWKLSPTPRCAA